MISLTSLLRVLLLPVLLLLVGLAHSLQGATAPTSPTTPSLGTFTIPTKVYGTAPFTIKPPTSPSKGAWGYASSDPTVATVSGSQITIVGAGSTLITATQAAAGNYLPASTSTTFTVTPAVPKLGTFDITTKPYGSAPILLIPPVSTSPGVWSFRSENTDVAVVIGDRLSIKRVGKTIITATQEATAQYTSASQQTPFTVVPGKPTLGSFMIPVQSLTNGSFTIKPPSSTSDGSWSYASSEGSVVATAIGTTITPYGAGFTKITANQKATMNWMAAQTNALLLIATNKAQIDFFGSYRSFTIDFVVVGNPGNSNDTSGYGSVPYSFRIGKYVISQNQIDAAVQNGCQNVFTRAWNSGDQPAVNITWYKTATYVNWLNTTKGYPPAYNLIWTNGTWNIAPWPMTPDLNGNVAWTDGETNCFRNAKCMYFLPSENEWYKAAYYDPNKNSGSGGYWHYPTGSDLAPNPVASGTNQETAVYNRSTSQPASVFQAGGLSPYGTMGQGGNVWQWLETAWSSRDDDFQDVSVLRGGEWGSSPAFLQSESRSPATTIYEYYDVGFRIAGKIPD